MMSDAERRSVVANCSATRSAADVSRPVRLPNTVASNGPTPAAISHRESERLRGDHSDLAFRAQKHHWLVGEIGVVVRDPDRDVPTRAILTEDSEVISRGLVVACPRPEPSGGLVRSHELLVWLIVDVVVIVVVERDLRERDQRRGEVVFVRTHDDSVESHRQPGTGPLELRNARSAPAPWPALRARATGESGDRPDPGPVFGGALDRGSGTGRRPLSAPRRRATLPDDGVSAGGDRRLGMGRSEPPTRSR